MKVIAEVGSNWKSLEDCKKSIELAKQAGADAVKFQYFTNKELYGEPGKRSNKPDLYLLKLHADLHNIEFMCTAFSPKGYNYVDTLVKTHKIASSEITSLDILEAVNKFKKPVYLSTGGAKIRQINEALSVLSECPVTIMFCVAEYPAKIIDFRLLTSMKYIFGEHKYSFGYSDHSIDVLNIPTMAKDHGATVIEKHVNFTHHTDTPDAPHSLNFEEFKLMVSHLKTGTAAGDTFRPNQHQRKIITLADGSYGYYRPAVNG